MNNNTFKESYSQRTKDFLHDVLIYRKRYNDVTGSVTASILLNQIAWRYEGNKEEPFFKFIAPCEHRLYRKSDSWLEELGFTRHEFIGAIGRIATKITKNVSKSDVLAKMNARSLVLYWTDADRVTYWEVNVKLLNLVHDAMVLGFVQTTWDKDDPSKDGNLILDFGSSNSDLNPDFGSSKNLNPDFGSAKSEKRIYIDPCSEKNTESVCTREKQPTHTGNSENFEDDRSGTLEQHPSETLDSGTLEQESLEIQTPVKKSKTEIEYLDLNNNPGLRISSAGARENLTSPAENAPKTRGNDLKVSNPSQPHNVPLSEFIQVYNKHRGNWRSIGVAPAPVVVAGIFGYRQSFTGTDEEFLAKFPLLLKAAQSSGGNWFKSKRNPSEIFHPDRLPLNDFWEDVQPAPSPAPEPQPQPSPAPTPNQTIKPTFFFGEI